MIHILAQQPGELPKINISPLATPPESSGYEWTLVLQLFLGVIFAILLGAFIWWLVQTLRQLGRQLSWISSKLVAPSGVVSQPQKNQQAPSEDALKEVIQRLDSVDRISVPIKVSAQKMQDVEVALSGLKKRLEELLSDIQKKEEGLTHDKAELQRLRSENPGLERKITDLMHERAKLEDALNAERSRLSSTQQDLDSEKAAHGITRSALEGRLDERAAELSVVRQDVSRLNAELDAIRADLSTTQAHRDEISAELERLTARNVDLEQALSASRADREAFIDWVLTKELREMFAEELGGILASKTDHELLSSLAMLKDAGSDLSDESVVLANIRHLGEVLVRFYRSQGLDAAQRDPKLRKWADFVNSKASSQAQVIVPGLKFPVNVAVMVAPDGVKVISDVHCWQVNNVKGVVYAPAKVS